MTDHTTAERAAFEANCAALPEGVSWGDALTPAIVSHIRAAQSEPATRAVPVAIPEPDTTRYAQWAGDMIKYHSVDQLVEYGNACAKAALAAPTPDAERHVANHAGDFHAALVLEMSELCDRNSPEDEPDAMIANSDEMEGCIERALERTGLSLRADGDAVPVAIDSHEVDHGTHIENVPHYDAPEPVAYLSTDPKLWGGCRINKQGTFTVPVYAAPHASTSADAQAPAAWQYRYRKTIGSVPPMSDWRACTERDAKGYMADSEYGPGSLEVRALGVIAAPIASALPAQPVALTVEQREAIKEVICLARDEGLPGTADMLQSILAAPAQPTDKEMNRD